MNCSRGRVIVVALVILATGIVVVSPRASAATTTYSAEETIPVPPASGFQGSGGGDGWAVALTPTAVFNVHHHNSTISVACRKQVDASQCWTAQTKEATDTTGRRFSTLHPGLHMDQTTGFLYVYGTRDADGVGGVVCLDTAVADADPNPFCGFTALTAPGQSSYGYLTNGVSVGHNFYAVDHDNGSGVGAKVLCFDAATAAACPGQPYSADVGSGSAGGSANTISAIGVRLYLPSSGNIGCFDTASATECAGAWPAAASTGYGAPFPRLDASGAAIGVCNPDGTVPCFDLSGSVVPTPAGLASTVGYTQYWNGPALSLGPRIYVPSGTTDTVACYDYATEATCQNFPHAVPGASYMYTVNPDPQRPTCIWVNADNGPAQIQNFDAFGGVGCGEGPIRVLASSIVVNSPECTPTTYSSLAVLEPTRTQYGSGFVAFEDGSGQPLPGVGDVSINDAGVADLRGLDLNTAAGLPHFLITLTDPVGTPGSVTVRLTWTGEEASACDPGGPGLAEYRYVALGDSYSSGEGTYDYDAHKEGARCHRGPTSWPRIMEAKVSELVEIDHKACTGAKTVNLLDDYHANPPQIPSVPDPDTELVTITIGGNDVGFAGILQSCYVTGSSCAKVADSKSFENDLSRLYRTLTTVIYPKLEAAYPNALIVHVGYPRIMPATGTTPINCGWLSQPEQRSVDSMLAKLNGTIYLATQASSPVEWLDVTSALSGHELCTSDPWMTSIRNSLIKNSEWGHPNGAGQLALAKVVTSGLGFSFLPEF